MSLLAMSFLLDNLKQFDVQNPPCVRSIVEKYVKPAGYGGGVYVGDNSEVSMDAVELRNNTATSRGGGVYSNFSRLSFNNVAFAGNRAGQHGGGLYVAGSGTGPGNAFCDVDLNENVASSGAGGGIYLESTAFGGLVGYGIQRLTSSEEQPSDL